LAALAASLMAGCTVDPAETADGAMAPEELAVGGFYAFRHTGGSLSFGLDGPGSAEVVLYGGDDARVGRVALDDARSAGRFVLERVDAGDLVLHVQGLDGNLTVRSEGREVEAFSSLPTHVERHVLLQRPRGPLAPVGLEGVNPLDREPADETVEVQLLRAPSHLRLLLQGSYADLDVRVVGAGGPVLVAEAPSGGFGPPVVALGLDEIPSEGYGENVRDGLLTAKVAAGDFEGVLLLEAESFSRARPPAAAVEALEGEPRFTFGVLPDQPVSFQVRAGAERIYLFQERDGGSPAEPACEAAEAPGLDGDCPPGAVVALFGPHDERVAIVEVPADGVVAVRSVGAGEWVAVLLSGEASLGTDLVPADFELHPLEVEVAFTPESHASGRGGEYASADGPANVAGVPFRAAIGETSDPFGGLPLLASCGPASLALRQDGETIGSWGHSGQPSGQPELLLDGGELTVAYDDFGPGCPQAILAIEGYVR
jgi:hypothetical protein